jgi:hypothetical protein
MKVIVNAARTASPSTAPVSACRPDGMSTATTGRPDALTAAIITAASPSTARASPVPKSASTITSASSTDGDQGSHWPPSAAKSLYARRASLVSDRGSPSATTAVRSPRARARRATT